MDAVCSHYDGRRDAADPPTGSGDVKVSEVGQATSRRRASGAEDCILCLQEVKITQKKLTKENCCIDETNLESFHATSDTRLGYSGTSIYTSTPAWRPTKVRTDLFLETDGRQSTAQGTGGVAGGEKTGSEHEERQRGQQREDSEGRFCAVDLHPNIVLVNVYVPNAGLGKSKGSNVGNGEDSTGHGASRIAYKMKFYKRLLDFCTRVVDVEKREVVLVGDFNACFDARDVHALIGIENAFLPCELDALRAFTSHGFVDAYRRLHPDVTNVYTCFDQKTNARQYNRGVRIDFCLVSAGLADRVTVCEVVGGDVVPARWSDHCALYVEIDVGGWEGDMAGGGVESLKEWVQLKKRLTNSSQRTLMDMFGPAKKKAKQTSCVE